ncbi:MAG: DUF4197 domain-containing protein [Immundisolibacter sp.]|uniref:DUF4197 domain-containing protein n=1 Tax=Immundisolibacter sp. TaxID=1934948 RepID=UPI003D0D5179
MRTLLTLLAACLLATAAQAVSLADLSAGDASGGLKDALTQGAGKAVGLLGRPDGFLDDSRVRIGLPGKLRKAEGLLRQLGLGNQTDELITTMNRAAEAAVPAARPLLVDAIRQMTVSDARAILTGGDDAATRYFERTTSEPLGEKFKPIVSQAMAKLNLNQKFQALAGQAGPLGMVKDPNGYLEDYVTRKTMDGLFLMIAQEEKAIRKNPASAAGSLARKVFGAL